MHYVFGILLVIYFILQSSLVAYLQVSHKKVEEGPLVVESKEVFDFIRNNTAKNDVIIFSKPLILPLFIERRSIDTSNLSDYRKGEYLLLNEYLDGDLYNNQLFRKGDLFRKVFENKKFLLFKIIK